MTRKEEQRRRRKEGRDRREDEKKSRKAEKQKREKVRRKEQNRRQRKTRERYMLCSKIRDKLHRLRCILFLLGIAEEVQVEGILLEE